MARQSTVGASLPIAQHAQGHHLLAFTTTTAAVAGLQQIKGVTDPLVPIAATNDFQIFEDYEICAAYAGGAAALRARFTAATLALRGSPQIVPIEGTLLAPKTPNFMEFTSNPIQLRVGENLRAEMENNSATLAAVLAWIIRRGHDFTVPYRDLRWIRATATITTTAGTSWVSGPITLDEPLEGGDYGVFGMQAFNAAGTLLAARLIFPGQVMRPGCLAQATAVSRSAPMFWGGLGLWGIFNFLALPQLEVLDTAANASQLHTIWLLCSNTLGIAADLA
jgi:hypothetical protein